MHWVDRGPEPVRLPPVRERHTPGWVRFYAGGEGERPTDHAWQTFRDDLKSVFHGLCAYCEQVDPGEVEHFRPKSRFPEKVYVWSNWLFSCHSCNQAKREKWPDEGYIDPCATISYDRPEHYFEFFIHGGRIIARPGLSCQEKSAARRMIEDLKLNEWYQVKERKNWIDTLEILPKPLTDQLLVEVQNLAKRSKPLSSITRVWLAQRGYPVPP